MKIERERRNELYAMTMLPDAPPELVAGIRRALIEIEQLSRADEAALRGVIPVGIDPEAGVMGLLIGLYLGAKSS